MYPGNVAADKSGMYFQDARGSANKGFLVHANPTGSIRLRPGPVNWPLTLAGGKLYELAFHNSGGEFLDGFKTSSLARISSAHVPEADVAIADTSAGLLVLTKKCGLTCAKTTVSKIAGNGSTSGKVSTPFGFELVAGPSPAVVEFAKGHMFLARISS